MKLSLGNLAFKEFEKPVGGQDNNKSDTYFLLELRMTIEGVGERHSICGSWERSQTGARVYAPRPPATPNTLKNYLWGVP